MNSTVDLFQLELMEFDMADIADDNNNIESVDYDFELIDNNIIRLVDIQSDVINKLSYDALIEFKGFDGDYVDCDITIVDGYKKHCQDCEDELMEEIAKCYVNLLSKAITSLVTK